MMKRITGMFMLLFLLLGCSKDKNPKPGNQTTLDKPALLAPAANETCTTGQVLSATQSTVTFTWNAVPKADKYELTIINLLTYASLTKQTDKNTTAVTLSRGTPYSWGITAKSVNLTESKSDLRKFYNAGEAITSYAPFPADLVAPALGKKFQSYQGVILEWEGSSVENNIKNYDVYLGTQSDPPLLSSNITNTTYPLTTSPNTIYYWKIVTRDINGNTSVSATYQFEVRN